MRNPSKQSDDRIACYAMLCYFDLFGEFFEFLLSLNFSKETLLFKKTNPNVEVCPKSLRAMLKYCESPLVDLHYSCESKGAGDGY